MSTTQANRLPERVLITGGTGFIGTALAEQLLAAGVSVAILSRNADRAARHFGQRVTALESLSRIDAANAPGGIVNLAGKNLGEQRWNASVKQQLVDSRVSTTQQVVDYIARAEVKPDLLISGSAVGYYGARGDEALNEEAEPGNEFQCELCRRWEQTALQAEQYGIRVCISRTGVVMGQGGGALSGLEPMFRKGLGAVAGNGRQWLSWVHVQDLINMFLRFMLDDALSGPFNNTSPNPVTNRQFAKTIGKVLHRPVLLRAPAWAMHLLYGEMAHLYVTGQKVIPDRHLQTGFDYQYPDIESALRDALSPGNK